MASGNDQHFAIRFTGDDGVEKLYVAKALAAYPRSQDAPGDASAEMKATIAALEALLGTKSVVGVDADAIGAEGQMIG